MCDRKVIISPKVNMCKICKDLEVNDKWLGTAQPQREIIGNEVDSGRIKINGILKHCNFCRSAKRYKGIKQKNLYKDSAVSAIDGFVYLPFPATT